MNFRNIRKNQKSLWPRGHARFWGLKKNNILLSKVMTIIYTHQTPFKTLVNPRPERGPVATGVFKKMEGFLGKSKNHIFFFSFSFFCFSAAKVYGNVCKIRKYEWNRLSSFRDIAVLRLSPRGDILWPRATVGHGRLRSETTIVSPLNREGVEQFTIPLGVLEHQWVLQKTQEEYWIPPLHRI